MLLQEKLYRRKSVFWLMIMLAWLAGFAPQNGVAMPVDSQSLVQPAADNPAMAKIQKVLQQETVRHKLKSLGLSEPAVMRYLTQLDDSRLRQVAQKADALQSAGDGGAIIFVLLLALIGVLFLYMNNYEVKVEPRKGSPSSKSTAPAAAIKDVPPAKASVK